MQISIVTQNGLTKYVFLGTVSAELSKWVSDLNSNPLIIDKFKIEEKYTSKSLNDIENYLLGNE